MHMTKELEVKEVETIITQAFMVIFMSGHKFHYCCKVATSKPKQSEKKTE